MTHEELLTKLWILPAGVTELQHGAKAVQALRAVVELHQPATILEEVGIEGTICTTCGWRGIEPYPCPTIQAIKEQLK